MNFDIFDIVQITEVITFIDVQVSCLWLIRYLSGWNLGHSDMT